MQRERILGELLRQLGVPPFERGAEVRGRSTLTVVEAGSDLMSEHGARPPVLGVFGGCQSPGTGHALTGVLAAAAAATIVGATSVAAIAEWAADAHRPHLLSPYDHATGVSVGQVDVHHKTNEIPRGIELLAQFDLTGTVITLDALHTQRETAEHIVDRGARASRAMPSSDGRPGLPPYPR